MLVCVTDENSELLHLLARVPFAICFVPVNFDFVHCATCWLRICICVKKIRLFIRFILVFDKDALYIEPLLASTICLPRFREYLSAYTDHFFVWSEAEHEKALLYDKCIIFPYKKGKTYYKSRFKLDTTTFILNANDRVNVLRRVGSHA